MHLGLQFLREVTHPSMKRKQYNIKKCLEGASTRLLIGWNERL
jgi:hypothetical protein